MKRFKLSRQHTRIGLGVVAISLVVVYISMYLNMRARNQPLDEFLDQLLVALDAGDTGYLYARMHGQEKSKLSLSRSDFEKLYDWYKKSTANVVDIGDPIIEEGQGGYFLFVTINKSNGQDRCDLELVIHRTEAGPRFFFTRPLIYSGLVAKYIVQDESMSQRQRTGSALERGILAEREFFEGIGMKGVIRTDENFKLLSWDQQLGFVRGMQK